MTHPVYARVAGEHIRVTGLTCLGKSTPYNVKVTENTAPLAYVVCADFDVEKKNVISPSP